MTTLLEKAKSLPNQRRDKITDDQIDLALAWLRDEVSVGQVSFALSDQKKHNVKTYVWLATRIQYAYAQGKLAIEK